MTSRPLKCSIVVLTLALGTAACSSSSDSPSPGSAGAAGANVAGGGSAGIAGGAGTAAGGSSAGASSTGGGASGAAGAATAGAGGAAGGAAGVAGAAGSVGTAGAAGAGTAGATGTGCPAGALFCADFEEASGPPAGSTLQDPDETGGGATFDTLMKLDTVAPFAGKQSLAVTSASGGFQIRMLAVPVPTAFWVRLWIKSDQDIGQDGHNAFFQAMTDPNYHNSSTTIEVAEQFSCVLLNMKDNLYPSGTTCTVNTALAKNTWHCMEAHFDGAAGNVTVFAEKTKIIDAVAWPSARATLNTFEFGYASYHPPGATVWYDNVSVTTTQTGCP